MKALGSQGLLVEDFFFPDPPRYVIFFTLCSSKTQKTREAELNSKECLTHPSVNKRELVVIFCFTNYKANQQLMHLLSNIKVNNVSRRMEHNRSKNAQSNLLLGTGYGIEF